jgi:hypothetical protein
MIEQNELLFEFSIYYSEPDTQFWMAEPRISGLYPGSVHAYSEFN